MPSINLPILRPAGPLVQVLIGPSRPRQEALKAADLPVPGFSPGIFLIDTGASCTCVDPGLVEKLGIPASGSLAIQTPSTQGSNHHCNTYDVALFIPNPEGNAHYMPVIAVVETHLSSQGIDGLIGRDLLQSCVLVYNGLTNMFSLSY